ncbi:phosphatase PAP2 family protein [Saccharopolyspora sp. WRP15-2]|uniref:Phosphatase PAP2 family protein n=1 Tax=Saccharopolyspora oryzae TaxID=2997343 RepID=A0ABT4UQR3_9PSEU|nr:phosphatase PAP2 family protein [Saccharopolyspora oryzae]MDA3624042.1 phosphatase PAP2 family protein [Saccharopolyspora oryzae]
MTGSISSDIAGEAVSGVDDDLFHVINDFARATPWLHGIVYGYATYGVVLFAVLLLAGWWTARRSGEPSGMAAALWAGIGTLVAVGLNQPIVSAVHEARPYNALSGILVLADRSTDFSFPSDHATMVGAVAAGLFLVGPRLGSVAALAAALMAFSRVYIAAHYPQDVLAGLVFGAVVVLLGWLLARSLLTAAVGLMQRSALRPLVAASPTAGAALSAARDRGEVS